MGAMVIMLIYRYMGMVGYLIGAAIDHAITTFSSKDVIRDAVKQEACSHHGLTQDEKDKIVKRATDLLWSSVLCQRMMPWAVFIDFAFIVSVVVFMVDSSGFSSSVIPLIVFAIIATVNILLLIKGIKYYYLKADSYLKQSIHVGADDIAARIEKKVEEKARKEAEAIEEEKREKIKKKLKYRCADCNQVTKYGANYCSGCGKKINWEKLIDEKLHGRKKQVYRCDSCDAEIKPGMKYCPGCGDELDWSE